MNILDEIWQARGTDRRAVIYIAPGCIEELAEALWQRLQVPDTPERAEVREYFKLPKHETKTVEEIAQELYRYRPDLYGHPIVITDAVERFRVGE